jgi:two-component system, OmpR family, sensor kinase
MRQPQSIRFQLTAVFLGFFLLVVVLGLFSIWRLSNFNALSADVADVWLPDTRVLGDLNNFTSDFRAIEGSNLLSSEPAEIADTERQMAELDRSIANAERGFEQIRHQPAEQRLYERFKTRWTDYRTIVNRILALSRTDRKADALAIYTGASRSAYDAASDTLGRLTDQAVAAAAAASERLGSAYRQAFWLILLAMLLAGLMVVLALIHISRSISAPLLHLAGRMRALAANNTDIDIPETARRDEIGEMAQATTVFRNNAIELMRSQYMLGRQAAMLEEQLAQEQRLALAQRNFISMASHEFRTPLTIIDGHARRLMKAKSTLNISEIDERSGKIRTAVLRLTHLIDNLLNSARLADGGAEFYFQAEKTDLAAVLQDVCQLHREMVPNARIAERFDAASMPVVGDAKLLFQAFSNLVANAVKYSPSGGLIEVDAGIVGDQAVVAVVDRGIGIPSGDLGRLFERYYRGSNVSGIVGTGVGLYLVKTAVELHGGVIEVTSSEGEGSRFVVRLPRRLRTETEDEWPPSTSAVDAPSIAGPGERVS